MSASDTLAAAFWHPRLFGPAAGCDWALTQTVSAAFRARLEAGGRNIRDRDLINLNLLDTALASRDPKLVDIARVWLFALAYLHPRPVEGEAGPALPQTLTFDAHECYMMRTDGIDSSAACMRQLQRMSGI